MRTVLYTESPWLKSQLGDLLSWLHYEILWLLWQWEFYHSLVSGEAMWPCRWR